MADRAEPLEWSRLVRNISHPRKPRTGHSPACAVCDGPRKQSATVGVLGESIILAGIMRVKPGSGMKQETGDPFRYGSFLRCDWPQQEWGRHDRS